MRTIVEIDKQIIAPRKDLFALPVVIRIKEFDVAAAELFSQKMSIAHNNTQPVIPIIIDSPGGNIRVLLRMLSEIDRSEKPVATISMGQSMSCGAFLLAAGSSGYRYADPTTTIMVHDATAGGRREKSKDLEVTAAEAKRVKKLILDRMDKDCGWNSGYFATLLKKADNTNVFMTARQAKKHQIVDHIGVPTFKVSVNVEYEFTG